MNFSENRHFLRLFSCLLIAATALCIFGPARAQDMSANGFAWSESAGWIGFKTTHGAVTVHDTHLSGYAWAENIGWVKMGANGGVPYGNSGPNDWGVNRNASGELSGYAWSEAAGWISFYPSHDQVIIDAATGIFEYHGWSENLGWIHFSQSPLYGLVATERIFAYAEPSGNCGIYSPCYAIIQDGVDNVENGTTLRVAEGTFYENVVIDRNVTLELTSCSDFTAMGQNPAILVGP